MEYPLYLRAYEENHLPILHKLHTGVTILLAGSAGMNCQMQPWVHTHLLLPALLTLPLLLEGKLIEINF